MKTLIIHHDDLDGRMCAAIASKFTKDSTRLELGYGDRNLANLLEALKSFDRFYMLDFSFNLEDMQALMDTGKFALWIDHHESSYRDFLKLNKHPSTMCLVSSNPRPAACVCTWRYFSTLPEPEVVRLAGMWDTWEFVEANTLEPMYLQTYENYMKDVNGPDHIGWLVNMISSPNPDIQKTVGVIRWASAKRAIKKSNIITFKGQRFHAINSDDVAIISAVNDVEKILTGYPLLMFTTDLQTARVSLRTSHSDFDCTTIARGHKKAAGMVVTIAELING